MLRSLVFCLILSLGACQEFIGGIKGGLLRITVENEGSSELNLEVSSRLEVENEVESPLSLYTIAPGARSTLLHGYPCRRYGQGSESSVFTFKAGSNFQCSFRGNPGCEAFPLSIRCGNEGCTFPDLPWPVQCE